MAADRRRQGNLTDRGCGMVAGVFEPLWIQFDGRVRVLQRKSCRPLLACKNIRQPDHIADAESLARDSSGVPLPLQCGP